MEIQRLSHVLLVVLLIAGTILSGASVASSNITVASSTAPVVYVDPPVNSAQLGQNFTININVANVTDLRGWEFSLYFKPLVLSTDKSMIKEGPFLSQNGTYDTQFTARKELIYWHVSCILKDPGSRDGSGTLATITFLVEREDWTKLDLITTILMNPDPTEIPHTTRDGHFSNVRDIEVWDVTAYPTTVSVGEFVFIDVTVSNHGNDTETFDVTTYYDNNTIGSQTVTSLTPATLRTFTITWNTTGHVNGTYTISANASILDGEIDTDNNRFDDGTVTLTYAPAAIFTYSPTYPLVDENVTFDGTESFDPDGYIVNFTWNFGDNTIDTTNKTIITHAFASAGYYTVNLTVTDNENLTDTELKSVAVGKPNASFTFTPDSPIRSQTVIFNASSSTPRGGIITNYTWNFGDGNITTVTDPTIGHVYRFSGSYTVTLTVTDSEGMWDTESKPITVRPPVPPKAAFTFAPVSPLIQETVIFNATESTPNGGTITSYEWDFGDANITTLSEQTIMHVYESAGTYTVTLNVTDSEGMWDTESKPITVKAGPEASFSFSPTTPVVNDIVTFDATASTDPDGTIVSYEWNFGDGNITTATDLTIIHTYKASGNYTVTLKVTDNDGFTDTETKSIEVQETPQRAPDIILYLAVAIVIIAIAAVVVYFIKIRKPS